MKTLEIYTDGACTLKYKDAENNSTGPGGWGVYVESDGEEVLTVTGNHERTTNNRMEMEAFLKGLEVGCVNLDTHKAIYIFSDSAYILNCFKQKWYIKWEMNDWRNAKKQPVKNKDLWMQILHLYRILESSQASINLVKVKGHTNVRGNNIADRLAVAAKKEVM